MTQAEQQKKRLRSAFLSRHGGVPSTWPRKSKTTEPGRDSQRDERSQTAQDDEDEETPWSALNHYGERA
jgi:hypothetical protein